MFSHHQHTAFTQRLCHPSTCTSLQTRTRYNKLWIVNRVLFSNVYLINFERMPALFVSSSSRHQLSFEMFIEDHAAADNSVYLSPRALLVSLYISPTREHQHTRKQQQQLVGMCWCHRCFMNKNPPTDQTAAFWSTELQYARNVVCKMPLTNNRHYLACSGVMHHNHLPFLTEERVKKVHLWYQWHFVVLWRGHEVFQDFTLVLSYITQ